MAASINALFIAEGLKCNESKRERFDSDSDAKCVSVAAATSVDKTTVVRKNPILFSYSYQVMSSRALRRLQKEQLPDITPKKNQDSDEEVVDSEEEEEAQAKPIKPINPFDLVNSCKQCTLITY